MRLPDKDHPIWNLARTAIVMGAVCFFLWLNASNFDHTEFKAIIEILVAVLGVEGASRMIGRK